MTYMNESTYELQDLDALKWEPIIAWIIEQVESLDFGETVTEDSPFVDYGGDSC